jgi:hypothetical protein
MDMNQELLNRLVSFFTSLHNSGNSDFIDEIPEEVLLAIDSFGDMNSQNFFMAHPEGVTIADVKTIMCGNVYLGWKLAKEMQKYELDSLLGKQE